MPDFLLEIGLEEIPARMLAAAQAELATRVLALLERERLAPAGAECQSFSTPRRLAVLVRSVEPTQPDLSEELLGPAAKIAYRDGQPTPAALAFARKAGVPVEELRTLATPKGDYVAATSTRPGRPAADVLCDLLPKELAAIYWAKTMYWRAGKPERLVRPLRWIVALLGGEVVPVAFAGKTAARLTYGHRVLHGPAAMELSVPADYAETLRSAYVMADVELRRHTIRKALDRVCRTLPGMRWREDHALVDKLTHLTEWPSILAGDFDPAYLALPEEVLVTVMRDHQNYFAVEDSQGRLAAHFLAVLNTATGAEGEAVIRHGNARVLRARFNDARFFWQFDQRLPLTDRAALLEHVTFQKDLGSYAAKSGRVAALASALAASVAGVDTDALATAARLAKTDLTTELVKEFTELQGQIGGLYARHQGFPQAVADAIYDQYLPVSSDDLIPRTREGQLLALADKADTVAGLFSLGLEPTGSRDPFALRRAGNGIVKILAETELGLDLAGLAGSAVSAFPQGGDALAANVLRFLRDRLEFYLREARGYAHDVVQAVLALPSENVRDASARAEALTAMRGSADFAAVSAALKRMQNILAQAREKSIEPAVSVDHDLLAHPAEQQLAREAASVADRVEASRAAGRYQDALEAIATMRRPVDAFFDGVMVMDRDARLRANRLALLARTLEDFGGIADFSQIVTPG